MSETQQPILAPVARTARFVTLGLSAGANAREALARLSELSVSKDCVIGIGEPLVRALAAEVAGLASFPALSGGGVAPPSK